MKLRVITRSLGLGLAIWISSLSFAVVDNFDDDAKERYVSRLAKELSQMIDDNVDDYSDEDLDKIKAALEEMKKVLPISGHISIVRVIKETFPMLAADVMSNKVSMGDVIRSTGSWRLAQSARSCETLPSMQQYLCWDSLFRSLPENEVLVGRKRAWTVMEQMCTRSMMKNICYQSAVRATGDQDLVSRTERCGMLFAMPGQPSDMIDSCYRNAIFDDMGGSCDRNDRDRRGRRGPGR